MADEATTEATPDAPAEKPEQTPDKSATDEPLGDAGKKALDAERREKRAAEKRATELEARLKEFEDRDKTDLDKTSERATQAEDRATKAESRADRAEIALEKGLTLNQAKRLVGSTREELEADADDLLKDLGDQNKPRSPLPDPNQGRETSRPDPGPGYARIRDAYASK